MKKNDVNKKHSDAKLYFSACETIFASVSRLYFLPLQVSSWV